ncbi:hypothetical protein BHM03_00058503 [Ensete ventricosum]|nr:hypothetical protein BHM03_00058503 [Ensete ventricosum]
MASHFLRALFRIQHTTTDSSFAGRSRKIRRAAYSSMAYSVGTKRSWSSALLRKLRSRSRLRSPNPRRAKYAALPGKPRVARPQQREMDQAQVLRELVPGGTSMDDCRLLEETTDFVRCLSTQAIGPLLLDCSRLYGATQLDNGQLGKHRVVSHRARSNKSAFACIKYTG